MSEHLSSCGTYSLAETYPDEPKPAELSDRAWYEVRFVLCAEGCPSRKRDIERGEELAERFGWA